VTAMRSGTRCGVRAGVRPSSHNAPGDRNCWIERLASISRSSATDLPFAACLLMTMTVRQLLTPLFRGLPLPLTQRLGSAWKPAGEHQAATNTRYASLCSHDEQQGWSSATQSLAGNSVTHARSSCRCSGLCRIARRQRAQLPCRRSPRPPIAAVSTPQARDQNAGRSGSGARTHHDCRPWPRHRAGT
jgi:hypothetical protein